MTQFEKTKKEFRMANVGQKTKLFAPVFARAKWEQINWNSVTFNYTHFGLFLSYVIGLANWTVLDGWTAVEKTQSSTVCNWTVQYLGATSSIESADNSINMVVR